LFDEIDLDGNGYITVDEVFLYKLKEDPRITIADLGAYIKTFMEFFDANRDNKISRVEFFNGMARLIQ